MLMKQKVFSILALLLTAATAAMAQTYSVTVKEGTEDAADWRADPNPATNGETVTIKYSGTRKIESVRAVRKPVLITAITLNKSATEMDSGSTETLSVSTVSPGNASDRTVAWSSDNESVATVDQNGTVTAKTVTADATVSITATATDGGGAKATCVVTVKPSRVDGGFSAGDWENGGGGTLGTE